VLSVELARPGELVAEWQRKYAGAAVVDLFRATSTLQVLVDGGHREIAVIGSRQAATQALRAGRRCVGEWLGATPAGFSCGNSPVLARELDPAGPPVTFLSTNGAGALMAACRAARLVYAANLLNIEAVRRSMLECGGRWLLIPAGRRGTPCVEDDYFCARLAGLLRGRADLGPRIGEVMARLAGVTADDLRRCPAARRLAAAEPTGRADVDFILAGTPQSARIPVCAGGRSITGRRPESPTG
jgi:phosphosulfolactate phosphohydrolase-like enzyme